MTHRPMLSLGLELSRKCQNEQLEAELCFELANAYRAAGKHDEGSEYHAVATQITKRLLPKLDGSSKQNLVKYFDA